MLKQESIKLEINVPAKMRDGTILYADIYRPDSQNKHPAILTRTPYNKSLMSLMKGSYLDPQRFARSGYAVVIQDCRGTGVSEGDLYPFRGEDEDGYDTVEWIASQPWCDGNVGMYGLSYLAFTQWAAAMAQPPHLKAICPAAIAEYPPYATPWKSGVFNLQMNVGWSLMMNANQLMRSGMPPEKARPMIGHIFQMMDNIEEQCRFLPLKDNPAAHLEGINMAPFYTDWLAHIDDDDYWKEFCCSPFLYDKVTVPTFHMSGWYDFLTGGVLANYRKMGENGGTDLARKNQKVLIGPWPHGTDLPNLIGALDFGAMSTGVAIDVTGMHLRWFDHWLKGIDNGITDEPPVRIFVMGDNVWRDENEWPLARAKYTEYYFHSNGHAKGSSGDGALTTEPPDKEQTDVYLYDPRNPVPSTGGIISAAGNVLDAQDLQEIERRTDILIYTSPPLETDVEVTGPIELKLWAASSAVDTDFVGKLVDVWPNGKSYNLAEGIIRARYREGATKAKLIEPGRAYQYSIDMKATSNVFKAGHRIRIEVCSSNFPRWDCNPNTGHPIGQDAEMKVAVQTIYHDRQHPSHIVLPVIPG
jgi:putative CocE/NonD family hydrolase